MTMLLADSSDFVGAIAILAFIGLPIVYAMVNRFLAHQERMAMLQRGIVPPPDDRWARRAARHGWTAPPPPPPPYGPDAAQGAPYPPYHPGAAEYQAHCLLRKGVTLTMIGFALLVGLSFIDRYTQGPGPWLLGGLIPMFAGIAQVIIALMSGARLGDFSLYSPRTGTMPPPPAAGTYEPPGQQPRGATSGPYAWRPGSTTELKPPPSPPDVRN